MRSGRTIGLLLLGFSSHGLAAGFAVDEQSPVALGTALAGRVSHVADASVAFYNPAGMSLLPQGQLAGSIVYIARSGEFKDAGSTLNGVPLAGGDGGNPANDVAFPSLFVVLPAIDRLSLGLSVTSPFGLNTIYEEGWLGRYQTVESDLVTVNVNPAFSYRLGEALFVGGGVSVQYLAFDNKRAIDFGSDPQVGAPQALDGSVAIDGDSIGYGFNVGALYAPTTGLSIGLAFRSGIRHEIDFEGDFDLPVPLAGSPAAVAFSDGPASADLDLPAQASLGIEYQASKHWALLADITWTDWSVYDEVVLDFANPATPDLSETQDWDDSFRLSVGAVFTPNSRWTLRAGLAFDETPVPDAYQRPSLATSDRVLVGLGVGYRIDKRMRIDLGYLHSFEDGTSVDIEEPRTGRVRGTLEGRAELVAAQFTLDFE